MGWRRIARVVVALVLLCGVFVANGPQGAGGSVPDFGSLQLGLVPVAGGLSQPVAVAWRHSDPRMYVVEKVGRVRLVNTNGSLVSQPVLDLTGSVAQGSEQGLLGATFSPDGTSLVVDYTGTTGNIEVDEYTMLGDVADTTTRRVLLTIPHSTYPNHNGGEVIFGPDGKLYIGVGDGGGAGDPLGNAQNLASLLGKILRINPDSTIPGDNPFVGDVGVRPEIWMYGLRNPWRFSFDRQTGQLWVGDVGQDLYEEVDAGVAGGNYGWNLREGFHPYNGGADPPGAVDPLFEEAHSDGWCAIVGGYVYRGSAIPGLQGTYIFGDDCRTSIVGVSESGGVVGAQHDLGVNVSQLSSFGEDPSGELYLLSLTGTVYKLVAGNSTPSCTVDGTTLAKGTSIKVGRGLTSTPAAKPTNFAFMGDMTACTNFDAIPTKITPVTAGTFHVKVRTNPGSTCSTLAGGVPLNSSLVAKFQGLRNGKLTVAETDKTAVASLTMTTDNAGHDIFTIVSTPITTPTSALNGRTITLQITTDQDTAAIASGCATPKKGLTRLTFNNGTSSLSVS
jgi:glucose/arabinose dehydrogenase